MFKKKKRTATKNKRRQGKLAILIPWLQKFGLAIAIILTVIWVASWLTLGGYVDRANDWAHNSKNEILAQAGFRLENIFIEGRENANAATIKALINMEKGDPLFAFNPKEAQNQIKKMAWVADAKIERRWPATIFIHVQEHLPTALLQKNDRLFLLDENFEIIHTDKWVKYKHLIMISGAGAQKNGHDLLAMLKKFPEIEAHTESAKLISNRRWDLTLKGRIKGGVTIKLPEKNIESALLLLQEHQKNNQLLDKDLKHIDLRNPDRMIVRTKPGQVMEYKSGLEESNDI